MSQQGAAIALAIILYVLAGHLSGPSSRPSGAPADSPRMVAGYYVFEGSRPSRVQDLGNPVLTAVAPWSWALSADGEGVEAADPESLGRLLQAAGSRGLESYALVHNYLSGTFDRASVHRLLTSPAARGRAANTVAAQALRWGVEGVTLDLENVPAEDREALSAFVQELAGRLRGEGLRFNVAVPAKTSDSPRNPLVGAYDYQALGKAADQLWLMTYDEHYAGGPPGPVASYGWVERTIRYAVSRVPPSKLVLGLAAYGYEWDRSGGPAQALTYNQVMARLQASRATLRWHPDHKVPYFTYGTREVWFEDRYSAGFKAQLAARHGLAGVVLWRLGQEDPGLWEVLGRAL